MAFLVDSHAHLTFDQYRDDIDAVIASAQKAGLKYILTVGTDFTDSVKAVELSQKYHMVYASVGTHPHDASKVSEDILRRTEELCGNPKVVAVGETGLDYYYNHSPKDIQQKIFREHIKIAQRTRLPLMIHSRDAAADTLRIVRETRAGRNGGVVHCYSYDLETARKFIDEGFMISFTGAITFPKARETREVASALPYEKIMVETDCPFLAPVPHRGKRNEPAFVSLVAKQLSEILPLSYDDICRITTGNFENLYHIQSSGRKAVIAYPIRDSLYLNITNRCTNNCYFCVREFADGVSGYNLKLESEPSAEEIINAVGDPSRYREVVFCGFGEPTVRIDTVIEVSKALKAKGAFIRLNTNGHGNSIHKRNILPELNGLIDSIAISLNAHDDESYLKISRPLNNDPSMFNSVLEFAREAKKHIPFVEITCVATPEVDIDLCRELAEGTGAEFRIRSYNVVG